MVLSLILVEDMLVCINSYWQEAIICDKGIITMHQRKKITLLFNANKIYDRQIIKGIGAYLQSSHAEWDIFISDDFLCDFNDVSLENVDAIIADYDNPDIRKLLKTVNIPIVGTGSSYYYDQTRYPHVPYIATDNYALIEMAFLHLLSKGIEHFALYSMPPSPYACWAQDREYAFSELLKKYNYSGSIFQGMVTSSQNWGASQEQLSTWLKSLPENIGIIAITDTRARNILQTCEQIGIKVPEQCCVIGIDNEEIINYLSRGTLTTIEQGTEEMGYRAAKLLDKMMNSSPINTQRILIKPKKIIELRSTDYRALTDALVINAMHFIRNNACSGIKAEQVISAVKSSRSNLEARFKKELNKTIHNVIHDEKFSKASYLVSQTDLPIQSIYQICGYPSLQYFYFLFKKKYDMTPTEYRIQNLGKKNKKISID